MALQSKASSFILITCRGRHENVKVRRLRHDGEVACQICTGVFSRVSLLSHIFWVEGFDWLIITGHCVLVLRLIRFSDFLHLAFFYFLHKLNHEPSIKLTLEKRRYLTDITSFHLNHLLGIFLNIQIDFVLYYGLCREFGSANWWEKEFIISSTVPKSRDCYLNSLEKPDFMAAWYSCCDKDTLGYFSRIWNERRFPSKVDVRRIRSKPERPLVWSSLTFSHQATCQQMKHLNDVEGTLRCNYVIEDLENKDALSVKE